jgi:hypothetical protein
MKHNRRLLSLGLATLLLLALPGAGAAASSVRSLAMGDAYTAIASDLAALYSNPAGIGQRRLEISGNIYASGRENLGNLQEIGKIIDKEPTEAEFADFTSQHVIVGAFGGISIGPVAVAMANDGELKIDVDGVDKTLTARIDKDIAAGFGLRLASAPLGAGEVRAGLALHMLQAQSVTYTHQPAQPIDTVETVEDTAKGLSATVGVMAKVTSMVNLGVTAENLGYRLNWESGPEERKDIVYRAGVSAKLPILGLTVAADVGSDSQIRYGAESNLLFNFLSLRAGQVRASGQDTKTTFGAAFNLGPLSMGAAATRANQQINTIMLQGTIRF